MSNPPRVIGLDVGAVAVSAVLLDQEGRRIDQAYRLHRGDVAAACQAIFSGWAGEPITGLAATSSTPDFIQAHQRYDNRVAVITAGRKYHPGLGSILIVGGEKFGLIQFDPDGAYRSFKTNTSCAAGTGSFLDQQARRLGLENVAELARVANANQGEPPRIASRCAVFAKTDLVHAQQEGYSLNAIADGLCRGLAQSVVDTLFLGESIRPPLLVTGGVARNQAVVRHLKRILETDLIVDPEAVFGAAGAALMLLADPLWEPEAVPLDLETMIGPRAVDRTYGRPPLCLVRSNHPDFAGQKSWLFTPEGHLQAHAVEVDVYEELGESMTDGAFLGVDVGSTSTKAVLMLADGRVLAGFYTRTAGRPLAAVQALFAALTHAADREKVTPKIIGLATTGSGRKLSGRVFDADLILDEITAHARAAVRLNPNVDTIIEIGGQDAKFTTLKDGRVTFSVMNTVCAAGTGSFIEELAGRLNCSLADYSARAEGRPAPVTSDRCTVFMERDVNQYLRDGYTVDEVLASLLHSIRENYLTKVAVEHLIGQVVLFQGATAKNRALVAAFEQRLDRPIHVSRFCHLTGAYGAALTLADQSAAATAFKGPASFQSPIPVESEVCGLCNNHCKITVADLGGRKAAYGFLCGRDYDTRSFVDNNRSGFDLMKTRKKAFALPPRKAVPDGMTIGLPAGLHLHEDLPRWKVFFGELGVRTITSEHHTAALAEGKRLSGAEFCAPMMALHGHVRHLLDQGANHVFLPVYLEQRTGQRDVRRQYCYYTQYAGALCAGVASFKERDRIVSPVVHSIYNPFYDRVQLYRALKAIPGFKPGFFDVSEAAAKAEAFCQDARKRLMETYRDQVPRDDIHVVLLGRPYSILSPTMNKGIPQIVGALGVRAFYQDMLDLNPEETAPLQPLLDEIHWRHGALILEAAWAAARTRGAYPVFVTSFKCTPDSFIVDYFKRIMDAHQKPYLVLQLDEHDSNVGYETRIEAALRSFRNHWDAIRKDIETETAPARPPVPRRLLKLGDKTLFLPRWDAFSQRLIVANLKRGGLDARLLESSDDGMRLGLARNTGQCIPLQIVAQEFIDNVQTAGLDPGRCALWFLESKIACNLGLFGHHVQTILEDYGQGMEKASVYQGLLSFIDLSYRYPLDTYFAYLFGGALRRLVCRWRPYEAIPGQTDRVAAECLDMLEQTFSGQGTKTEAAMELVRRFQAIPRRPGQKPKVAIFGDLYVRDNETMNRDLVRKIEEAGGEVVTTPFTHYCRMVAPTYVRKWFFEGKYFDMITSEALMFTLHQLERKYWRILEPVMGESLPEYDEPPARILSRYGVKIENTGESADNLLKIHYLLKEHPDLSLFVQTSPAFCCPSLVTEGMARQIEEETGVPVVSLTYDGTGSNPNEAVIPYLKFPRNRRPVGPEANDRRRLELFPLMVLYT